MQNSLTLTEKDISDELGPFIDGDPADHEWK